MLLSSVLFSAKQFDFLFSWVCYHNDKWNEKTIDWFLAASKYTGYNKKLAALLLHRMTSRGTLCDLGCGMGLIDFELASSFRRVHCVDIDATAVNFVNSYAKETATLNVTGCVCNARELEGRWDHGDHPLSRQA
jgi:tRNA/tmRNA/rRNA uracil-C5-methylase (TrmA/RlmC/RlmD family)